MHSGTRPGVEVPGVEVPGVDGRQQFVGHRNLERILDRLEATLGPPDTVLLAGASMGGFGTLVNLPEVAARFPGTVPALLFEADSLERVYAYLAERHTNGRFGLASTREDATIRTYFGFGQPDGAITGAEYATGLADIEARLPETWRVFATPGDGHTFVGTDRGFFGTSPATDLGAWLRSLLDDAAAP